jgi:hypothetical protein
MESMQANMPWMNMAGPTMVSSAILPSDITKSQYLVLSKYRQGMNKSKDIARALSTDKHHVEAELEY